MTQHNEGEFVSESPAMIAAGVETLRAESFGTPHEELVSLIYAAMEYQRRRECASDSMSPR